MQSVQRSLSLLFQLTFFLMFPLFRKYVNRQVRTNKMTNSVAYYPCPSRLASRIHPFISLQNACWIFTNFCVPPCVGKTLIYGVHIPRKCIESMHFYPCLSSPLKTLGRIFWRSVSPETKGVEKTDCFIKVQSKQHGDDLEH